jgi:hypothetical protein
MSGVVTSGDHASRDMVSKADHAAGRFEIQRWSHYPSFTMIHENLSSSIDDLSSRIIAIRDSL